MLYVLLFLCCGALLHVALRRIVRWWYPASTDFYVYLMTAYREEKSS